MAGYGFPSTFGFVIAGIVVIVGIHLLALREQRRGTAPSNLEHGSVNESSSVGLEGRESGLKEVVEVPKQ